MVFRAAGDIILMPKRNGACGQRIKYGKPPQRQQVAQFQHLVFGLQEFNLPAQLILSTPCQIEKKRRKPTSHVMVSLDSKVRINDDNLFALLN